MGLPTSLSQDTPVTGYTNSWSTGLFVQNNFRIVPRVTLNLGLRWDIQTPPTDPRNRGTSFEAGVQSTALPQAPLGALVVVDPGITRRIVPWRWHQSVSFLSAAIPYTGLPILRLPERFPVAL